MTRAPKAFISYSWDSEKHKQWVAGLASRLREDGVETILDQWHAVPGDQLPAFMEREIRRNDYVLIICTPSYKEKSDERKGGVGYEGDIMIAEVFSKSNHRKYIPILAYGSWEEASPSWLMGKYYVDLRLTADIEQQYQDLLNTILGKRMQPPPVKSKVRESSIHQDENSFHQGDKSEPIEIMGVIVDEVTEPRHDGTRGSALYEVPFRLSRRPSNLWAKIFLQTWQKPAQFTSMHRPGIASIHGDKVVLDGTTIEEVKKYHRATLMLCLQAANEGENRILEQQRLEEEAEKQRSEEHKDKISKLSEELDFD